MEKPQKIRSRIKSTASTEKITSAMEMIASSKIRRAQKRVYEAREFAASIEEVITDIACFSKFSKNPLLVPHRKDKTVLVLGITADRGLCGGYNSSVIRLIEKTIRELKNYDVAVKLDIIGTKGKNHFKYIGYELTRIYENLSDYPRFLDAREISKDIISRYLSEEVDRVLICFTRFKNTAEQIPAVTQLLPIPIYPEMFSNDLNNDNNNTDFKYSTADNINNIKGVLNDAPFDFEKAINERILSVGHVKIGDKLCRIKPEIIYDPSHDEVLDSLLPQFVYTIVYGALLESTASETGARMTAMKSASDNAENMIKDLMIKYHRARQQQITLEISEIVSGAGSLA